MVNEYRSAYQHGIRDATYHNTRPLVNAVRRGASALSNAPSSIQAAVNSRVAAAYRRVADTLQHDLDAPAIISTAHGIAHTGSAILNAKFGRPYSAGRAGLMAAASFAAAGRRVTTNRNKRLTPRSRISKSMSSSRSSGPRVHPFLSFRISNASRSRKPRRILRNASRRRSVARARKQKSSAQPSTAQPPLFAPSAALFRIAFVQP